MGISISIIKRKFGRTLSRSTTFDPKVSCKGVLPKNEADGGLLKFIDIRLHNIRNSKLFNNVDNVDELDINHYIIREVWDGDFKAPVNGVLEAGNARVLDVATGSGTWVMRCAEKFSWSNFTGVDVSSTYPQVTDIKLINVTFLQSNVLERLLFNDNTFDFVHMRCLTLVFTEKEWTDQVLKELVRVCKPGGWVELVELDRLYLNQGPIFKKLCDEVEGYLIDNGVKPILGNNLAMYFKQTRQVTDVSELVKNIPCYGSRLGKAFGEQLIKSLQAFKPILTSYRGYSNEEWDDTIEIIKKEIVEYKTEGVMRRIYCKKIITTKDSNR